MPDCGTPLQTETANGLYQVEQKKCERQDYRLPTIKMFNNNENESISSMFAIFRKKKRF